MVILITSISGSFEIANLKISQPLLNNSVSQLISILDIGAEGGGNFRQKLKLFWLAAKAKNVYRWCFFHEGTMFENKWFRTGTDWSLDVSNFFRRQKFEFERFVKSAKSIKGRSRLPLFGDRTILFLIPSVTSSDQISMSCQVSQSTLTFYTENYVFFIYFISLILTFSKCISLKLCFANVIHKSGIQRNLGSYSDVNW